MANYRKSFNFRNGVQVDEDNFIVQSSGLVGIGTSQPGQTLDVFGNVRVSGLTTTGSLFANNAIIGVLTATTLNLTTQTATNLLVTGIATVNGNITLGNDINTDVLTLGAKVNGSIIPSSDGTLDLGSSSSYWNTIYANAYQNFAFADLPTASESSFAADRLLKVKTDGTGYELVDIVTLNAYLLGGLRISSDDTVYTGIGSTVSNKLQISGISTVKFYVGEKVKVFGITSTTDSTTVPNPVVSSSSVSKIGTAVGVQTYRYWMAQYHLRNGKVGIASQFGSSQYAPALSNFNNEDYISLTLARTDTNHGILVYRQVGATADINQAKLIGILGPNELGGNTSGVSWIDYGTYDQPEWSTKGTVNEYTSNQIHFPAIATTGQRRGWAIDTVELVGPNYIRLSGNYKTNVGFGTTAQVKVVHDNTYAFKQAISTAVSAGNNFIDLPSGTYLTNKITIPSGFTLSGNGKNTIIKQQYFATDETDGGGNSLSLNGNVIGVGTTGTTNITIQDLTIDGNNQNNILFNPESDADNYLAYFDDVSSTLFKSIEIKNSPGHGLYIQNSNRVSIENCSIVDGALTDREAFQPLTAQGSQSLRINDSLFENYPGPVDLSVTSVVSTGGNIIRACGTGLRVYASSKITTTNNLILGPADEYIPSPDIYDSDFNSINITVNRTSDFQGPVLQYLENGEPKDLSSAKVVLSAGIGTVVGQGTTNETLGTKFLNFNIPTPDSDASGIGRSDGYVQLTLNQSQTSTLGLSSALGYDIIGTEYLQFPVGFTSSVGISTGAWNTIGAGATQYTVTLETDEQFSGISTGDVVKLVGHSVTPDLSAYALTVEAKIDGGALNKQLRLSGFTTTSVSNGTASGDIYVRNIFTIAKGRVGVI